MPKVKKRSAGTPRCATPRCRNFKAPEKNYCNTCRSRRFRENQPITSSYHNLKNRARQRGKEFLITLEEWRIWCEKTGYHLLKGKHADGMSVDRDKEDGPYAIGNIVMRPLGENAKKYHTWHGLQNRGKPDFVPSIAPAEEAPW